MIGKFSEINKTARIAERTFGMLCNYKIETTNAGVIFNL